MAHLWFGGLFLVLLMVTNPFILPFIVDPCLQMIIFSFITVCYTYFSVNVSI